MNAGCAGKTVRSLENACHIPERLRGVFTTRRYTNPRLLYLASVFVPLLFSLFLEKLSAAYVTKYRGIPVSRYFCASILLSSGISRYGASLDEPRHERSTDDLSLICGAEAAASSADRENAAAWAARTLAGRWQM